MPAARAIEAPVLSPSRLRQRRNWHDDDTFSDVLDQEDLHPPEL
jgi:hypothetical protein